MDYIPEVSWYLILAIALLFVNAELIDDFSTLYLNNLGGVRSSRGVKVILTYPRWGIAIPGERDYLIETLAPDGFHLNLTNKAIRIQYTAFGSGGRTIKLFESKLGSLHFKRVPKEFNVTLPQGHHQIDILLPPNVSAENAHAFGIGGPLFVHRVELVDTIDTPTSTHDPIGNVGNGPPTSLYSYELRYTKSPPQLGYMEYALDENHSPVRNLNYLHQRRDGIGIIKVSNGIEIMPGGFLYENLVTGSDKIDLTHKRVRIYYSTEIPVTVAVSLWFHPDSVHEGGEVASTVMRHVLKGRNKFIDVTFPKVPVIRLIDGKSISIRGPITIHNIQLVYQNKALQFMKIPSGWLQDTVLVDNLVNWPAHALGPSQLDIDKNESHSNVDELADSMNSVGQNNLNQPCMGKGVLLANDGIKLSDQGSIYERLSSRFQVYDLSFTHLEIEYSTEYRVSRQLRVLAVVPNDMDNGFHVEPVLFNIAFHEGRQKIMRLNIGVCGLSIAIRITGRGVVTLHQIRLHSSDPNKPDASTSAILDDFIDWPFFECIPTHGGESRTRASVTRLYPHIPRENPLNFDFSTSIEYDYRRHSIQEILLSRNCVPVNGVGVEILEGGYATQPIPSGTGCNVKITYSAPYLGTRRIVFITNDESGRFDGLVNERVVHVMLNTGQFQEVVFRVPELNVDSITIIAIRIHGPLFVHQIEFSKGSWRQANSPGQSTADSLLIDDFSGEIQQNSNILDGQRFTTGIMEPGSLTLRGFDEYLVESFVGKWDMPNLAFRITYTAIQTITCKMMLIPELWGSQDGYEPFPDGAPEFLNMVLDGGNNKVKTVYAWSLLINLPEKFDPVYGIAIHGPASLDFLTIHRIELLASVPFTQSMIPTIPSVLSRGTGDYEHKLKVFKRKLKPLLRTDDTFSISILRAEIWNNVYHEIMNAHPNDLQKSLKIEFLGELGVDGGGLAREFFTLLANAINDPNYGLFTTSIDANYALQINPNSKIHGENHLSYFRLVGRIIGMAILNENLLGIRFIPSLYKKFIEKPSFEPEMLPELMLVDNSEIDISGIKEVDPKLYNSMKLYLENDISTMPELTMELEWDNYGKSEVVELVKNGSQHIVKESNKRQYVREYVKWHTVTKIKAQANELRDGLWDLIPRKSLAIFNETELEMLIAGLSKIDIDDWITNTAYGNNYTANHPSVVMFWNCVKGWDQEKRAKLLRFVTGSPRVPASGFAGLKYKFMVIQASETESLPKAATCFNQIKLPPFPTPDIMCARLGNVIESEMNEFGFD